MTIRFGVFIPQGWRMDLVGIEPRDHWATMSRLADRLESGPWESIWVYDHFHSVPAPDAATHEAWTLMAAFAAATSRLRLGQMCTCMSYRNPAYLAKVAATVDIISGGRLEMGVGGGWYEKEWRAYGYGFPAPRERLRALDEGVQIMRQAWSGGRASLDGRNYQVADAIVHPLPLQQGGPPLWIAGGGEKVTLRIAAKYADYTNFDGTPDTFAHKSRILAEHCRAVGREFGSIIRSADYNIAIGETEKEVDERLKWIRDHYTRLVGAQRAERQMSAFVGLPGVGTPEQIIENFQALDTAGMNYAIAYFPELAYDLSGLELFEREVIPALS